MKAEEIIERVEKYLSQSELKGKYQYQASFKKYVLLSFSDILINDAKLAELLLDDKGEILLCFKNHFMVPILLDKCESITPIRDIRKDMTGKIIAIEGTVRQRSAIMPRRHSIKFVCNFCGKEITLPQPHTKLDRPSMCICARTKFRISKEFYEDHAKLNVEELPEESSMQAAKVRVMVREPLTNPDFVSSYGPGDRVYIVGILKNEPVYVAGKPTNNFKRYIDALFIKPLEEKADDTILKEDYEHINKIGELSVEEKLKFVSPSVVGHNKVKEALLLQLVGGVKKEKEQTIKREMIHILLVGSPSVAKSVMGKSVIRLKPRARYVGGSKGASSVGITAAVVKDEEGNFVLDCGSIVLANGSLLVIDEFEKMDPGAVEPLHEALEGGTISVDKAGVHATMHARTSVLAIANPKFGRWDLHKNLIDQVEMVPSLLSRFDFIFALKDSINFEEDEKVTSKILNIGKSEDDRDYQMFRKFIIHATGLTPSLTDAAIKELKDFFLDTRDQYRKLGENKIPITFRQLEGLIRLTEAYAKLRLASRATKGDAECAISIMKYYLAQLGMDLDTGSAEIDNIELGQTSNKRKADYVLDQIPQKEFIEYDDVIKACKLCGLEKREVESLVEKLKKEGEIFEPMGGFLQRL